MDGTYKLWVTSNVSAQFLVNVPGTRTIEEAKVAVLDVFQHTHTMPTVESCNYLALYHPHPTSGKTAAYRLAPNAKVADVLPQHADVYAHLLVNRSATPQRNPAAKQASAGKRAAQAKTPKRPPVPASVPAAKRAKAQAVPAIATPQANGASQPAAGVSSDEERSYDERSQGASGGAVQAPSAAQASSEEEESGSEDARPSTQPATQENTQEASSSSSSGEEEDDSDEAGPVAAAATPLPIVRQSSSSSDDDDDEEEEEEEAGPVAAAARQPAAQAASSSSEEGDDDGSSSSSEGSSDDDDDEGNNADGAGAVAAAARQPAAQAASSSSEEDDDGSSSSSEGSSDTVRRRPTHSVDAQSPSTPHAGVHRPAAARGAGCDPRRHRGRRSPLRGDGPKSQGIRQKRTWGAVGAAAWRPCGARVRADVAFYYTCTAPQPPNAQRYYPPTVAQLMAKAGTKKRTAIRNEVQQLVRDVLNLEKQPSAKEIQRNVPYSKLPRPAWWPQHVPWATEWPKSNASMDTVYEAAFTRLRALCNNNA